MQIVFIFKIFAHMKQINQLLQIVLNMFSKHFMKQTINTSFKILRTNCSLIKAFLALYCIVSNILVMLSRFAGGNCVTLLFRPSPDPSSLFTNQQLKKKIFNNETIQYKIFNFIWYDEVDQIHLQNSYRDRLLVIDIKTKEWTLLELLPPSSPWCSFWADFIWCHISLHPSASWKLNAKFSLFTTISLIYALHTHSE